MKKGGVGVKMSLCRGVMMASAVMAMSVGVVGSSGSAGASTSSTKPPTSASLVGSNSCTSSAPGVTPTSVTWGELVSSAGPLAAFSAPYTAGWEAYISSLNAKGGVYGRKVNLKFVDDGGSVSTALTGAQQLVQQDNVFGILYNSLFATGFTSYLTSQNVPAVGIPADADALGHKNYFSYLGMAAGSLPITTEGKFFKSVGGTKVAVVGLDSPGSIAEGQAVAKSSTAAGLSVALQSYSASATAAVFTAQAQQVKNSGADVVFLVMTSQQVAEFVQALHAINYTPKAIQAVVGYGSDTTADKALAQSLNNVYFSVNFVPPNSPAAGVGDQQAVAGLKKYAPKTPINFQSLSGWITGATLEEGMQLAGPCPTRAGFNDRLNALTNYTAQGLLYPGVSFKQLNTNAALCYSFERLVNDKFVFVGKGAICGKAIPS
jgi:branched-chain amino acid transport system substrate-binding protein